MRLTEQAHTRTVRESKQPQSQNYQATSKTTTTTNTLAIFRINKARLIESGAYFKYMLSKPWQEAIKPEITLEGDTALSIEIWFRLFHENLSDLPLDAVSIRELWHAVNACDKYEFDRKALTGWFGGWFQQNREDIRGDNELMRKLLFPCYAFDYAPGFQLLSKSLVYGYPFHITEINPTEVSSMHLPPRVIRKPSAS